MKRYHIAIIAFVALAAILAGVYVAFSTNGGTKRSLSAAMKKFEFTELVPPSTLVPPGTIISIIKDDPLVVGVICTPSDSLGSQINDKLIASESTSSKEITELTGEFILEAEAQDILVSKNKSNFVKNISLTLSNVKIIELPDSVVFDLISSRSDSCIKAMDFRRGRSEKISIIKSAIRATAVYRVQFDGKLDSNSRAQMTRDIAGTLGLAGGIKSDDTIEGDGLIWGVRDDVSLAEVSKAAPPATGGLSHPRVLIPGKMARVSTESSSGDRP